jgi:hypothetical protein
LTASTRVANRLPSGCALPSTISNMPIAICGGVDVKFTNCVPLLVLKLRL